MLKRLAMASAKKASTNLKPRAKSTLPQSSGKAQTRQLSSGSGRSYKTPESTLVSAVHKLSLNDSAKARNGRAAEARPRFSSSGGGWTNSFKSEWDVARFVKSGAARRVVVCVGAGLSTGSGIPDFRTPGSGLYDNLQKYRIPYPEAIFDIDYFHQDPKPFFELAKELYPSGKYRPNYCHYFLRMLHGKEQLLRIYTQNIDGLERLAGVPANKLVEAHGTFSTATCTLCGQKHDGEEIKPAIFSDRVPKCKVKVCPGVVKPDIVFFGEDLPRRFYLYLKDMMVADLIIVMGTSLEVQPFAGIVDLVRYNVPRILFNMEAVGPFRRRRRAHDFVMTGDLTESVKLFVTNMGWTEQMDELIQQSEEHKQAWVSDEGKPSQSPGVSNPTKGGNQSSQAPGASNIQPKRHMHMLNSAKSEGHRPKVFIRPQQKEISNVRHGLFPKLGSETRFRGYRKQQISSSEESSDSSDSSEEESR